MLALVAHRQNDTNLRLAAAAPPGVDVALVSPRRALGLLGPDDAALARLDVLPTLDGIEPGIWEVGRLEAEGIPVLNRLRALLSTHDKLQTSRVLRAAGLPHPRTAHLVAAREKVSLEPPVVVKPRFGSWGRDVVLCSDRRQLSTALDELGARAWFTRQGVLVQELVPPLGHDLRVVVGGGRVGRRSIPTRSAPDAAAAASASSSAARGGSTACRSAPSATFVRHSPSAACLRRRTAAGR